MTLIHVISASFWGDYITKIRLMQEQSVTDFRTNSLRILARIMAKNLLRKSVTAEDPSEVGLPAPEVQAEVTSAPDVSGSHSYEILS